MENYAKVAAGIKKEYPDLSDFEALTLAIELQRNQIIKAAFTVSSSDAYPPALEAIAIALKNMSATNLS